MFNYPRTHFLIGWFICNLAGCGSQPSPDFRRSQVLAFERGVAAFETHDFEDADQFLTVALKETTLHLDQLEVAHLTRSKARLQIGDFDGAEQDLDLLEEGATNMDEVWCVRGMLAAERGDPSGADAAYKNAKKLNPKMTVPSHKKP